MKHLALMCTALAIAACAVENEPIINVAAEDNDLGITHLTVERDTTGDERWLTIRGFDAGGAQVGYATLHTGQVYYSYEADRPGRMTLGTELTISVGEPRAPYVSPRLLPHAISEPLDPDMAMFTRLAVVESEIQKEAGITFARLGPPVATDEAAYAGNCGTGILYYTQTVDSCCQFTWPWYPYNQHTFHRAGGTIFHRDYGTVCTNSDGTTGCGGGPSSMCHYGPCGGHLNPADTVSGSNPRVFYSYYYPGWCGYDNEATGGSAAWPEEFDDPHSSKTVGSGMTPTCDCLTCSPSGVPMPPGCGGNENPAPQCEGYCEDNGVAGYYADGYGCISCDNWPQACLLLSPPECGCAQAICGNF